MLTMKDVSKVYRTEMVETHALRDLTLEVREGEFLAADEVRITTADAP